MSEREAWRQGFEHGSRFQHDDPERVNPYTADNDGTTHLEMALRTEQRSAAWYRQEYNRLVQEANERERSQHNHGGRTRRAAGGYKDEWFFWGGDVALESGDFILPATVLWEPGA